MKKIIEDRSPVTLTGFLLRKNIKCVEDRLRALEMQKWTTKNDELRVAEMHALNGVWEVLVAMLDNERRR